MTVGQFIKKLASLLPSMPLHTVSKYIFLQSLHGLQLWIINVKKKNSRQHIDQVQIDVLDHGREQSSAVSLKD